MRSAIQFSMRQLLVAVALVALGITALVNANAWWQSALWGLALVMLVSAGMMILYRREETRAFWVGFLFLGAAYLGLLGCDWALWNGDRASRNPLMVRALVTTKLSDWTYDTILPESRKARRVPNPDIQGDAAGALDSYNTLTVATTPDIQPYIDSGNVRVSLRLTPAATVANPHFIDRNHFTNVGHALWLIVLAALGGKLAQWIYRTRPKE